jgi:hypothetical protein
MLWRGGFRWFGLGGWCHWSGFFRSQAKFTFALTAHGTPPKNQGNPDDFHRRLVAQCGETTFKRVRPGRVPWAGAFLSLFEGPWKKACAVQKKGAA